MIGTYKVIRIIDDKTIMINYGQRNGAKSGEKIRVFQKGEDIYENNIFLGTLDVIKEDLEIIAVYSAFSLCQKITSKQVNPYQLLEPYRNVTKIEKLNVEKSEIENLKYKSDEPIKNGDLVKVL